MAFGFEISPTPKHLTLSVTNRVKKTLTGKKMKIKITAQQSFSLLLTLAVLLKRACSNTHVEMTERNSKVLKKPERKKQHTHTHNRKTWRHRLQEVKGHSTSWR